jgi:membrane protease YdiL (CAAX protease family)
VSQLILSPERTSFASLAPDGVPWGWRDIIRALALLLAGCVAIFALLVVAIVVQEIWGLQSDLVMMAEVAILGFYAVLLLAIYWCTVRRYGASWASLGLRRVSWRWVMFAPLCLIGMLMIFAGLQDAISAFQGQPFTNPQVEMTTQGQRLGPIHLLILLLSTAVAAPIVEELFFRGMLYPVMRRSAPAWAALVANAGVFAIIHFIPILLPMLFVSGLVLTLVRARTNSVVPGILIHVLQNTLFVLAVYLSFSGA